MPYRYTTSPPYQYFQPKNLLTNFILTWDHNISLISGWCVIDRYEELIMLDWRDVALHTAQQHVMFSQFSEGWPHHGRTFSIYLCPLSFWLTLPRRVLSTSWCCPSRPCVVFLVCVHLALFLALSLSPGNSLVSSSACDVTWVPQLFFSLYAGNSHSLFSSSSFRSSGLPVGCSLLLTVIVQTIQVVLYPSPPENTFTAMTTLHTQYTINYLANRLPGSSSHIDILLFELVGCSHVTGLPVVMKLLNFLNCPDILVIW